LRDVINWEDAETWNLPKDRVGDLIIANKPGFGWVEEITVDGKFFGSSLKSGYKQAIIPQQVKGMWTPFIIMGPGVKPGYALSNNIQHIDQYPTLAKLLDEATPDYVQGKVIEEILGK